MERVQQAHAAVLRAGDLVLLIFFNDWMLNLLLCVMCFAVFWIGGVALVCGELEHWFGPARADWLAVC